MTFLNTTQLTLRSTVDAVTVVDVVDVDVVAAVVDVVDVVDVDVVAAVVDVIHSFLLFCLCLFLISRLPIIILNVCHLNFTQVRSNGDRLIVAGPKEEAR